MAFALVIERFMPR